MGDRHRAMAATHLALDLGLSGAAEELNEVPLTSPSLPHCICESCSLEECNPSRGKPKGDTDDGGGQKKQNPQGAGGGGEDHGDDDGFVFEEDLSENERSARLLRVMSKAVGFEEVEEEEEEEEERRK